jgi:hypothetical protein
MRSLVPILLVSATAACTSDNGEAIIVLKNVAPGDGCTFTANESETFLSHGSLDLTQDAPYLFTAQMKSRVLLDADPTNVGATTMATPDEDARTIFVSSANVDLAFPGSAIDLSGLPTDLVHFKKLFSAVMRPQAITDATFELIPADVSKAILAINGSPPNIEVAATFTVLGDMNDDEVKSQPFTFPITLRNGGGTVNKGDCPLPVGTVVSSGNSCNSAQDGQVDCCTDATSGTLVCPAVVSGS